MSEKIFGGSGDLSGMKGGHVQTFKDAVVLKKFSEEQVYYTIFNNKVRECKIVGGKLELLYGSDISKTTCHTMTIKLVKPREEINENPFGEVESHLIFENEKELFEFLGLDYLMPIWKNKIS